MKQRERLHFRWRVLLLLIASGLVACVGELREISQPGQAGEIQGISPLPTGIATILIETPIFTPIDLPPTYDEYPGPTESPSPVPTVINLAQGLPQVDTMVVFISRSDGAFQMYLLPLAPLLNASNFLAELTKEIGLQPEDKLVDFYSYRNVPVMQAPPLESDLTRTPEPQSTQDTKDKDTPLP